MKMQGLSLSDIASELNLPQHEVNKVLRERFAYEAQFQTEDERTAMLALENARLDYYLSKLWASVQYGDLKAIAEARKISETRVKINQMDKIESTHTTQVLVIGGESQNYVDKLKELADG
jgi:hypothetical protein